MKGMKIDRETKKMLIFNIMIIMKTNEELKHIFIQIADQKLIHIIIYLLKTMLVFLFAVVGNDSLLYLCERLDYGF